MALVSSWAPRPEPRGTQQTNGRPDCEAILFQSQRKEENTQPGSNNRGTHRGAEMVVGGAEQEVQWPWGRSPQPR